MKKFLLSGSMVFVLFIGLMGTAIAGHLDKPVKYALSSSQKAQILNFLNTASKTALKKAYISSSAIKKLFKAPPAGRPYSTWDQMWVTSSVGSNSVVKYTMVQLGIYGPIYKKPTYWDINSSDKSKILSWVNSASASDLAKAKISKSGIKRALQMRPFNSWDRFWYTTSLGSNTKVKNIMVLNNMYTNPYDRYKTKPALRVRTGDHTKMIQWVKNASSTTLARVKFSNSARKKLSFLRSQSSISWKDLLLTFGNSDLKKIGIDAKAIKYVSGSKDIVYISGIGAKYGARFKNIKIFTVQQFLMNSAWSAWRGELAQKVGLGRGFIDRWAKRADLDRISYIGEQYGDLLAYAGVETVPQLAKKDAKTIRDIMIAKNKKYNLVNKMPSLTSVKSWIRRAKLKPAILDF